MSTFNYESYQHTIEKAKAGSSSSSVKVGYFKLKEGQEALVRIYVSKLDDLKFATVHAPVFGKKFEGLGSGFTPVSCLNEVGSYSDACPFCKAAAEGHEVVGKAAKKVYVQMLVAYKDATSGQFAPATPVVWERPAGFSKELATKLRDYEDLAKHVFKVTRIGSGKDTKYSLDYIPLYDKPELVPADFSAFANFDITKHSFWVKSAEELESYLATGSFPVAEAPVEGSHGLEQVISSAKEDAAVEAALFGNKAEPVVEQTPAPVVTPATAPAVEEKPATPAVEPTPAVAPQRIINKFSF